MSLTVFSIDLIILLFLVSAILGGLMAGFFFAYSFSVVPALDTLTSTDYSTVMQQINEKVLNVVFGIVFFGAVIIPIGSVAYVLIEGEWAELYVWLFIAGVAIYLFGTFAVTMRVHIPMNEQIATWTPQSPQDGWSAVRTRWGRWNYIRTISAFISFGLYLTAIASIGL